MANDIVIGSTLRTNINVIKRTTQAFETISERLATGKIVNSAIDNPQNFFAAKSLDNRAADFNRRLDQIGQSLSLIREAAIGTESIGNMLDQSEAIIMDSLEKFQAGEEDGALIEVDVFTTPVDLRTRILEALPVVYFPLDGNGANIITDVGVGTFNVDNIGPVGLTPVIGALENGASAGGALYSNNASSSVQFDGIDDRVALSDNSLVNLVAQPNRTVELVFNADTVAGRQILYEEGDETSGYTIYIDNGDVRVTAEDDDGAFTFSDIDLSAPIVAGQTYHVSFVYSATENRFDGYLNGARMNGTGLASVNGEPFPGHPGDVHIGGGDDGVQFHDGDAISGNPFHFQGRISDVAIYNHVLSDEEILTHARSLGDIIVPRIENQEYNSIRSQIDQLTQDAAYRGVNLLNGESTRVSFNENGSTGLDIEGEILSSNGLALLDLEFISENNMRIMLDAITEAKTKVRSFGQTLQNNLTILQTRQNFTTTLIDTHSAGSDDLTVSDQNEDGAELLALETRLSLATTALSLGAKNNQAIGNSIAGGIEV